MAAHRLDQPGGSTRAIDAAERLRLLTRVREFRQFLETELFATPLERINGFTSEHQLWAWHAEAPGQGDFRQFLQIALDTGLEHLGPGPGLYLSYGAYPRADDSTVFPRGLWNGVTQCAQPLDLDDIREDSAHAWLDDCGGPLHPANGQTQPLMEKTTRIPGTKPPFGWRGA